MKRKGQKSSCPEGYRKTGRLIPVALTPEQERYAIQALGNRRFVYNLALKTNQFHRHNRMPYPTVNALEKALNACKKEDYPFLLATSKHVIEGTFREYRQALLNWWDKKLPAGPPKLKRKNLSKAGSFLAAAGLKSIKYDGKYRLTLPRIGSLKLKREIPEGVIPYEVHLRYQTGQWLAAINYYAPPIPKPDPKSQGVAGLDVGINPLALCMDQNQDVHIKENPKAYCQEQKKLRSLQRIQSRRDSGLCSHKKENRKAQCRCPQRPPSSGWLKMQKRIDKVHRRIRDLRNDAHHIVSKAVVIRHHTLGIETLNVKDMLKSKPYLAKGLHDAALSGLLQKIRYKAEWYGTNLIQADRWYPSSKTCSACGVVNRELGDALLWQCPACGASHDRNVNAAGNLLKLALGAVRPEVTPRGVKQLWRPEGNPKAVKLETRSPELES